MSFSATFIDTLKNCNLVVISRPEFGCRDSNRGRGGLDPSSRALVRKQDLPAGATQLEVLAFGVLRVGVKASRRLLA